MSKQEQKDLRRKQILDTSLDLFVRNGYYGTTTKEIAQKLNMSQGLFFHYFESKDTIYKEHLERAKSGMGADTFGGAEVFKTMPPLKIIEIITETILQGFTSADTAKLFMLVAQAQICTKLPDDIKELAAEISQAQMMKDLIVYGQAKDEIKEGDAMALAGCWFSAIQGIAWTCVCFPFVPLPKAQWIADMLKA